MVMPWAAMERALTQLQEANQVSIVLRRGDTALSAQWVRIARTGGGGRSYAVQHLSETQTGIVVVGSKDLDIKIGDRFTHENQLYQIDTVRPNRRIGTQAQATLVQ